MKTHKKIQFEKRYQAALGLHLRQRPLGRSSPLSARSLGHAAVSLGLGSLDLARVHDRSVSTLASPKPPINGQKINGRLTHAGMFFLEALAPIEQNVQNAQTATRCMRRMSEVLRKRSAALVIAQKQLRSEIARRKLVQKQHLKGEQDYSRLLAQAHRTQVESQRVAHQLLLAQEEERKQISRELHDEVVQILAGINVHLATLKETSAISSRSLRQRVSHTQRLVEQSVKVVHRFALKLRPAMLDDLGLIPALRSYIKDLPGRMGLRIHLIAYPGVESLDNTRRTVLFRVAQEALTNVACHAKAHLVTVRIKKIQDAVRLEVHDDGKSFHVDRILASNTKKHLGLLGMRERIEMVKGKFSIESRPGRGTTVRADIPFRINGRTSKA